MRLETEYSVQNREKIIALWKCHFCFIVASGGTGKNTLIKSMVLMAWSEDKVFQEAE